MYLPNLLKADAYPSDMMTVLIGLVVVFAVLIVLTFIFWVFGKVVGGKEEKPVTVAAPAVKAAPKAPVAAPIADNGVTDEVVAVISAAIAAMSDGNTTYVVRRIRPAAAQGVRPVWAAAGIADNTRPF